MRAPQRSPNLAQAGPIPSESCYSLAPPSPSPGAAQSFEAPVLDGWLTDLAGSDAGGTLALC